MKKVILTVAAAAFATASFAQTDIYDTINSTSGGNSYYAGTGNTLSGDNIFLASPGAGMQWDITEIIFEATGSANGTYTVPLTIGFYNGVGVSGVATDPFFTDLAGTYSTTLTGLTVSSTANTGEWDLTGLNVLLNANPDKSTTGYGVQFSFGANQGTGAGTLSTLYGQAPSTATGSGSSNGFGVDLNGNGVIAQNEFVNFTGWSNGNILMEIKANAVPAPEPVSMSFLGLGVVGLIARKRRVSK